MSKKNNVAKNSMKVSVRGLVEFILRSGSIDNQRRSGGEAAMQEGAKIHKMIQRSMNQDYQSEVPLQWTLEWEECTIFVEGRADGIIHKEEEGKTEVTIDEIKGVFKDLIYITEPVPIHLAQAKCYGYMYGKKNGLEKINIQMTYCHMETREVKRFLEEQNLEELEKWFFHLIEEYKKWAIWRNEWKEKRRVSTVGLSFPFPYREGQKELAAQVYRTIYHKKKLFLQAPTGVGKTISTIFPGVMAIGQGLADKIFYLTAKTITRTVADKAFWLLREKGLSFKTVVISAKEKICFLESPDCNPQACPYAEGHFDRINHALYELLNSGDSFTREYIEEWAIKWKVCPFELSLELSEFADAIICDYNYVFDPNAALQRFFADKVKEDYLFLVDEAHNLVERGREMYSAKLYKEQFLEVKKAVKKYDKILDRLLGKCNKVMLEYKRQYEEKREMEDIGDLIECLLKGGGQLELFLESQDKADRETRDAVLQLYLEIRHFLNIYERADENYLFYTELEEGGKFFLKEFCMDPSKNLKQCLEKGVSTIFFSATLLPLPYYSSLLGGEEEDYRVYAQSPFEQKKRILLIGKDVSSKYTRRTEEEYVKIAQYIHEVGKTKKGNYFAFFPSYSFMYKVYESYETFFQDEDRECFVQSPSMTEEKKEEFLREFMGDYSCHGEGKKTKIGFCVLGGVFGEGIDLKEDSLIGALIVGTGIPQVCFERERIKEFFEEKGKNGFDYAYRYPGMNKVLQGAGRVIRTSHDKGVIVLLDDRFLQSSYKNLFPKEWEDYKRTDIKSIGEEIQTFWSLWGEAP